MSARLRILLVDDHAVVREGYRRLLEDSGRIDVVGEAASAIEAVELHERLAPDLVVMDIALPGLSGIEALRRIRARATQSRVLIFSMYEDAIYARRALDAGAAGYLTKASAPRTLIEAVDAVAAGGRYLSHDVAQKLALGAAVAAGQPHSKLSPREFEILKLLAQGQTPAEIAAQLNLTPKTVANHQSLIKQKLGVETAAQLIRAAMEMGLIATL